MIDIKSGSLFPWQFRIVAVLVIIAAIAIILDHFWVSSVLILAGVFALVSNEGTEVDVNNQTYREYTSFFFVKTGKFSPYSGAEKIFLTKGKRSQQMYTAHTTHSSVFENVVYNAYLKLSSGEKIHLLTGKDKDRVIKRLVPLSTGLNVEITDHT